MLVQPTIGTIESPAPRTAKTTAPHCLITTAAGVAPSWLTLRLNMSLMLSLTAASKLRSLFGERVHNRAIQTALGSDVGAALSVVVELVGLAPVVDTDDRALSLVKLDLGHALAVETLESGGRVVGRIVGLGLRVREDSDDARHRLFDDLFSFNDVALIVRQSSEMVFHRVGRGGAGQLHDDLCRILVGVGEEQLTALDLEFRLDALHSEALADLQFVLASVDVALLLEGDGAGRRDDAVLVDNLDGHGLLVDDRNLDGHERAGDDVDGEGLRVELDCRRRCNVGHALHVAVVGNVEDRQALTLDAGALD